MSTLSLPDLIIDALATHRLTRLVIEDEITADARDAIVDRFPPTEHKLGYFITCPHCVSMWAGVAVTLMRVLGERPESRGSGVVRSTLAVLRYTLAVSGAVSVGHEIAGKLPTQF